MFNDNPANFTWTSHDDLHNFKLQFVFSAGKLNAKIYTVNTGPAYALFFLFNLSEATSLSTKYG